MKTEEKSAKTSKVEKNGKAEKSSKSDKTTKPAKVEKESKGKPDKTAKTAKTSNGDKQPSNKEIVYKAWKKSKEKATPEELHKLTRPGELQLSTIKAMISVWKRGQRLPACASRE